MPDTERISARGGDGRSFPNWISPFFASIWKFFKRLISTVGYWLAFSVCIGLTPLFFGWIVSQLVKQQFSLEKAVAHGELLAITIALIGEAFGYLLVKSQYPKWF